MTDIGVQLVDELYQQLKIDEQWAVRRERGFTWWAYRLAQHVEVGPPEWGGDRYVCSIRIWTDVARNVDPTSDPAGLLAVVNAHATLNALVWDEEAATISECCAAAVHEEAFGWMSQVLATAALLQNAAAHSRAHSVAEYCGGAPAASDHPRSGERPEMDGLLNVPEREIARYGANPSYFAGELMQPIGAWLAQLGLPGTADATRLTCEVPFTSATPAMMSTELQTSLVQVYTDVAHPEFGSGALMLMRLPLDVHPAQVAELANRLNLSESRGDSWTPMWGAWCPAALSDTTLAFCTFVPNVLARPGLMETLLSYLLTRSRFAAEWLLR